MPSDLCCQGVLSVVSCSDLLSSWKPVLRYLLPAAVPPCCVYGFWSVPPWCFECCVLFRPVMFLEACVERPPACCSTALLCLWLLMCAVMLFWVLCPVQACFVPGNQCWETSCLLQSCPVVFMASDVCRHGVLSVMSCSGQLCSWKQVLRDLLSAAVPSCCVYGFWSVLPWCFECCVLFRPVMFLETSVEIPPACCSPVLLCLWLLICAVMLFWVLCPVPACYFPGNLCLVLSCSGQLYSWKPVLRYLPASVLSCRVYGCRFAHSCCYACCVLFHWLLCSWKPVLRYLLPAAVPSCCVYGFWCVPSGCFECCVLFRPVLFLETSVEIPPACCSPVLLCLIMTSDLCRHGVLSIMSCSGLLCSWKPVLRDLLPASVLSCCAYGFWSVPLGVSSVVSCSGQLYSWKPVLRDLHASVLSCRVYGCWSAHFWCSACCVLFWPVLFLETSVERLAYFSPVLSFIWLPICSFLVFCVLCPVLACLVPGNQCWETCMLQSCPVIYMAADLLIFGVLRVVSCFGLSCSWKPVLRDLHASVLSCHLYGCRSAHFWCSACCVLFWPVLFLETSVERPACCNSVLLCLWLLMCAVMMFWVLRPVLACLVPGNQCWETSCLLQSSPVLDMSSDLCCRGVLSVLSCSDLLSSWKPVLRDILLASAVSCCVYVFWSVPSGILSVVWLLSCFWPVVFLETSVEIPSACCSPVLL